jgi:hypothetical protein
MMNSNHKEQLHLLIKEIYLIKHFILECHHIIKDNKQLNNQVYLIVLKHLSLNPLIQD